MVSSKATTSNPRGWAERKSSDCPSHVFRAAATAAATCLLWANHASGFVMPPHTQVHTISPLRQRSSASTATVVGGDRGGAQNGIQRQRLREGTGVHVYGNGGRKRGGGSNGGGDKGTSRKDDFLAPDFDLEELLREEGGESSWEPRRERPDPPSRRRHPG